MFLGSHKMMLHKKIFFIFLYFYIFIFLFFIFNPIKAVSDVLSLNHYLQNRHQAWVNSIHYYYLDNGLNLIVRVDHRAPMVVTEVWYQAGSADESFGKTGAAHFLAHMMYRGTTDFPPKDLIKLIMINGGSMNIFTSHDSTAYIDTLPSAQLNLAFELESARMQNLSFNTDAMNQERKVVLAERHAKMIDNPVGYLFEVLNYVGQRGSPYSHPILGWQSDLEQLTQSDLLDFYQTYYQPELSTVVVIGDVDPDQVYHSVSQYFGGIKIGLSPEHKNYPMSQPSGIQHILIKKQGAIPTLLLSFRVPTVPSALADQGLSGKDNPDHEAGWALILLKDLLSQMSSSIFQKNLVRDQSLASSISVHYDAFELNPTVFTVLAHPMPGVSLAQLRGAIVDAITALASNSIDSNLLQRAKKYAQAQYLYSLDSFSGQADFLGQTQSVGLSLENSQSYLRHILNLDPSELQRVVRTYFIQDNLTDGMLMPAEGV